MNLDEALVVVDSMLKDLPKSIFKHWENGYDIQKIVKGLEEDEKEILEDQAE